MQHRITADTRRRGSRALPAGFALAVGLLAAPGAPAHDDSQPFAGHPPLHAQDTMHAFQDAGHLDQQLSAQSITACVGGVAGGYPCNNIDLLAFIPLSQLGGGNANDIWGWTDPASGREFALMGTTQGTAFVELTDPVNPVYLGLLPRPAGVSTSSWRDIKVFANHAFIGSEALGSGLQVMDLGQLLNVPAPPVTFVQTALYTGFSTSHNIVIDEDTGYAYAVGINNGNCGRGLHMVDILDPANPVFAGCFGADGYTHDAQCVLYTGPDPDYQGREICFAYNEDTLTIVDVTDKSAPSMISRTGYPQAYYTHQGWLTDDQAFVLMDDELDEYNDGTITQTRTLLWDVSDLDNPVHFADYTGVATSIDHNQYVVGNHVFQANYTSGLRVLDISDIANGNLTEVGYFDIYPSSDAATFHGAWSVYPFFPSGNVVVSGIEQGLFVLRPNLGGVSQPPEVAIDNPPDGATGLNGTVQIRVTATDAEDADGTLNVDFNIDGGAWTDTVWDGSAYLADWNSAGVADGTHTINARAVDSSLSEAHTSANVTVSNPSPQFIVAAVTVNILHGHGNRNTGEAGVTLQDSGGNPVAGVALSGTFSGDWAGAANGTSDSSGQLWLSTPIVKNLAYVQFCVDSAGKAGWTFDAAGSTLCGDSNGAGAATGNVTGTVSDAATSAPVANAGVGTDTGQSGTTAADGSYLITGVPVGDRTVSVTANGYQPGSQSAAVFDSATTTVDFQLDAQAGGGAGAIKGTAYASDGGKLAGVLIQVLGGSSAVTNKGGKYNLQSIPEGTQSLTASLAGYLPQTRAVDVAAGSTVTVDFTLTPQ